MFAALRSEPRRPARARDRPHVQNRHSHLQQERQGMDHKVCHGLEPPTPPHHTHTFKRQTYWAITKTNRHPQTAFELKLKKIEPFVAYLHIKNNIHEICHFLFVEKKLSSFSYTIHCIHFRFFEIQLIKHHHPKILKSPPHLGILCMSVY